MISEPVGLVSKAIPATYGQPAGRPGGLYETYDNQLLSVRDAVTELTCNELQCKRSETIDSHFILRYFWVLGNF